MLKKAVLICSAICIVLTAIFLVLNSAHASNHAYPTTGDVFVKVQGKSMEPAIHDGAIVKCKQETSYKVGDVVAFPNGAQLVSHRIIWEFAGSFITKGDGNIMPDINLLSKDSVFCMLLYM